LIDLLGRPAVNLELVHSHVDLLALVAVAGTVGQTSREKILALVSYHV
jgi:hypothetical protein